MAFGILDIPTLVVIDDDPHHIDLFLCASQNATNEPFKIECVKTLAEGINRWKRTEIGAIFISLSLLDCHALEMLEKVSLALPNVPILIMAGARDIENGLAVLQLGARGYLLADHLHHDSLDRCIRKLVERRSSDGGLFTAEKRAQITPDSIGAPNTQIQYRIMSIRIGTGAVPDPEFKIREVLMSKRETQYIPPSVIAGRPYPGPDFDAEYTMIVDPDSRSVELGLTPPIHAVCDNCWKQAEMESCGWTDPRGEGTICCFCGAFTENGKCVAYWAINARCENKHSRHIANSD